MIPRPLLFHVAGRVVDGTYARHEADVLGSTLLLNGLAADLGFELSDDSTRLLSPPGGPCAPAGVRGPLGVES